MGSQAHLRDSVVTSLPTVLSLAQHFPATPSAQITSQPEEPESFCPCSASPCIWRGLGLRKSYDREGLSQGTHVTRVNQLGDTGFIISSWVNRWVWETAWHRDSVHRLGGLSR